MDIETLEKWLPFYKNHGALLRAVPRELVPEVVRKCAEHGLECDVIPEDSSLSLVVVKGIMGRAEPPQNRINLLARAFRLLRSWARRR